MANLPTVGGSDNAWGGILNEFLNVAHNSDGTLRNPCKIALAAASLTTLAAGATIYLGPGIGGQGTTESQMQTPCGIAGTLKNMYLTTHVAPGAGQSVVATLRKNGVATSITATISGGSATTASDTTNTVSVARGDLLSFSAVTSAGMTALTLQIGIELDPVA